MPSTWPRSLKLAFAVALATAILMLSASFIQLSIGFPGSPDIAYEIQASFMRNMRLVAWWNIAAALALAGLGAQLRLGKKSTRRWMGAIIGLSCFFNLAGFVFQAVGIVAIVIVILLIAVLALIFRPEANAFIREKNGF